MERWVLVLSTEYEIQLSKFYSFVLTIGVCKVGQCNPLSSFLSPKSPVRMKGISLNCEHHESSCLREVLGNLHSLLVKKH